MGFEYKSTTESDQSGKMGRPICKYKGLQNTQSFTRYLRTVLSARIPHILFPLGGWGSKMLKEIYGRKNIFQLLLG